MVDGVIGPVPALRCIFLAGGTECDMFLSAAWVTGRAHIVGNDNDFNLWAGTGRSSNALYCRAVNGGGFAATRNSHPEMRAMYDRALTKATTVAVQRGHELVVATTNLTAGLPADPVCVCVCVCVFYYLLLLLLLLLFYPSFI